MRMIGTIFLILTTSFVSAEPMDYRAVVHEYVVVHNRLTSGAPDSTVEDLYSRGVRLGKALLSSPVFESMPESEFRALEKELPGFILNREEVLIAEPDSGYFLELAKTYGRPVDIAYFSLRRHIHPDGTWPVYIEQQTDYSGCTLFGQGKLVDSYQRLRDFGSKFPRAYTRLVAQDLMDVEEQVTMSSCACGNGDSVSTELDEFGKAFPGLAVSAAAAARAQAVREQRSTMRFSCVSG
jgi:hypothetical protein